jgi:hypothetical protein
MTYSCSDFADDVTNEAAELGLLTKREKARIARSDNPASAADAVILALRRLAKPLTIICVVEGGMVMNVIGRLPRHIKVVIRDYDTEGVPDDEVDGKDSDGNSYTEAVFGSKGFTRRQK